MLLVPDRLLARDVASAAASVACSLRLSERPSTSASGRICRIDTQYALAAAWRQMRAGLDRRHSAGRMSATANNDGRAERSSDGAIDVDLTLFFPNAGDTMRLTWVTWSVPGPCCSWRHPSRCLSPVPRSSCLRILWSTAASVGGCDSLVSSLGRSFMAKKRYIGNLIHGVAVGALPRRFEAYGSARAIRATDQGPGNRPFKGFGFIEMATTHKPKHPSPR
jgi:hypothetical protein